MFYCDFNVAEPLRPFIQCIWTIQAEPGFFKSPERLLPDGNIEVLLNFGDEYTQYAASDSLHPKTFAGSQIVGQRRSYYMSTSVGKIDLISISFKPGGLSPFVDFPVADITGSTVSIKTLRSNLFSEIEERVYYATDLNSKINLIQQVLLNQLNKNEKANKVFGFVSLAHSINQYSSISHFLHNHTINKRKLERDFDHHVGISPKLLQRLLRFKRSVKTFYSSRVKSLTDLAYECGYFDQAHFINDFKEFAGLTPRQFFYDTNCAWTQTEESR